MTTPTLDPAVVFPAWVAALRSGKYQQGMSTLRDGDKFCCLGVLCDIIEPTAWKATDNLGDDREFVSDQWGTARSTLPLKLDAAMGFEMTSYDVEGYKDGTGASLDDLIEMNDEMEATFEQIADRIQARYIDGPSLNTPRGEAA